MSIKELTNKLGVYNWKVLSGKWVFEPQDSNTYSRIYTAVDTLEGVEEDEEEQRYDLLGQNFVYKIEGCKITLTANFEKDVYRVIVEEDND